MGVVVLLTFDGGVFRVVGRLSHPAATRRPTSIRRRRVFVAALVSDGALRNRTTQIRPPRRVLVVLVGQRHLRRRAFEAVGVVLDPLRRVGAHILDDRLVLDDLHELVVDLLILHRVEVARGVADVAGGSSHLAATDDRLRFEQRLAVAVDRCARGGKLLVLRKVVVVVAQQVERIAVVLVYRGGGERLALGPDVQQAGFRGVGNLRARRSEARGPAL